MRTPPDGPVVSLHFLTFMPSPLRIAAGTAVTWVNDEPITHTITSGRVTGVDKNSGLRSGQRPDGLFDATLPGKGSTFTFTFDRPGSYTYYCDIHQGMNAEIVVS